MELAARATWTLINFRNAAFLVMHPAGALPRDMSLRVL
jgi:hypothetical protein